MKKTELEYLKSFKPYLEHHLNRSVEVFVSDDNEEFSSSVTPSLTPSTTPSTGVRNEKD